MANPPIGSNFIEGPLGVVLLNFDSIELGKTVDEASLEFIEDMKDILFAQNGTQPYDQIPTGQAYKVTCKLGQPTWARLQKLLRGQTGVGDSVKLGRDIYRSGRDSFAKVLTLTRVDSDGAASTDPKFKMTFWLAIPSVSGALGAFGPDTQRAVEVSFYCLYDETAGHAGFGYSGIASSVGVY